MHDALLDARFEADLRDALRLELASVRVGVAAPQVRGRICGTSGTSSAAQGRLAAVPFFVQSNLLACNLPQKWLF